MNAQMKSSTGNRLYRQVVTKILALTDSGEYPTGSRLPSERDLAERFSVSRPTIREAVIALEAQGVVTVKTGSGVYVCERQPGLLNLGQTVSPFELIEARVYLEGEAAAIAASLITDAQLSLLKELLKEMAKENVLDYISSAGADRKFHSVICAASNNQILGLFISQLWEAQENVENIKQAHSAVCMKDVEQRMAEHEAIYEALKNRDANAARAAMRSHFARMLTALHQTTEEAAVNQVKLNASKIRERFSFKRMVD